VDSRAARRLATARLAHAARQLCADTMVHGTSLHGLSDADTLRVVKAFTALAHELDVRTGAAVRGPRPVRVDPAQEELFTVDSGGQHEKDL
jgi:hypothetical protein